MAHSLVPYTPPGQPAMGATASPMLTVTGFSLFDASTPGLGEPSIPDLAVPSTLIGSSLSL